MSGPAWTPGPWRVGEVRHAGRSQLVMAEARHQGFVCELQAPINTAKPDHLDGEEMLANARLISAAPDLVEALENFMGLYDSPVERRRRANDPLYPETISTGRAALAKARGEQS